MNKWYEENLSNNDIVISSRVSLLRNLMDYPFPMKLEPDRAAEMIDKVKDGFFKDRQMDFYTFKGLEHTDKCQLRYLIDSYLVSRRIKQYPRPKALIIDLISALASTLSIEAFSTFRILPRIGRMA